MAGVAALAFFLGSWHCGSVPWTFTAFTDGSPWVLITYGDPAKPGGKAVAGYVAGLGRYVYRDFHSDGAYADVSSAPPQNGRWEWTGPYYPAGATTPMNGRITYVQRDASHYDRIFQTDRNGTLVPMGGDSCMKD